MSESDMSESEFDFKSGNNMSN